MSTRPTSPATTVGLTLGVVGLALSAFGSALPSVYAVGHDPATDARVQLVRAHVAHAAGFALVLGLLATIAARSPLPVLGAAATCGWMAWQYDAAARRQNGG